MPGVWVFPGGGRSSTARARRRRARRARARARRPGSSSPATPSSLPGRAGSRPRWSRSASTPMFYVALAPPHSPPRARRRRGRRRGAGSTPRARSRRTARARSSSSSRRSSTSRRCSRFASADEVLARAREREVEPILPQVVGDRRGPPRRAPRRARLPGASDGIGFGRDRSLPQEVREVLRALHHLRVHDGRLAPAADHLAGDAVLLPGRADDRRHDRARLPEEGRRRPAQPAGRPAVLRPDRLRDRQRDPGARPGHRRRRRPRPRREPRALLARVAAEKLPATQDMHPPKLAARPVQLVLHAHLRQGPARAGLRLARRRPRERAARSTTPTSRRCARATAEEPAEPHAAAGGGGPPGTSGSTSSAAATRPPCSSWVAPDGFPLSVRVPVALDRGARRIAIEAEPAGLPLIAGPRLPHRPRPRARLQLAGELPGPRRPGPRRRRLGAGPAQADRRLRAARRGQARPLPPQPREVDRASTARPASGC